MSPTKLLFPIFVLCFSGCSKKNTASDSADSTAPVITISSPINNQNFSSGATIQVFANATDNYKVSQLHIHVLNKTTGDLLRDIHAYPTNKTGTVEDSFTAQAGWSYTIKIIAYDPSQNISTAQVDVSVH